MFIGLFFLVVDHYATWGPAIINSLSVKAQENGRRHKPC